MGSDDEEDPSFDLEEEVADSDSVDSDGDVDASDDESIEATAPPLSTVRLVSTQELKDHTANGRTVYDGSTRHVEPAQLYSGTAAIAQLAATCADSPLALFYLFLPKTLWISIAAETNRYQSQMLLEQKAQRMERQEQIKRRRAEHK